MNWVPHPSVSRVRIVGPPTHQLAHFSSRHKTDKEQTEMAWLYEIRNLENAVLKRDGGFATQDAAKTAGREDAQPATYGYGLYLEPAT
jgi:hypothetical protein